MRERERERERERKRERVAFSARRAYMFIDISYKGDNFVFFDFFVRFIKVPNFRILQFLKFCLSKQGFPFSLK